MSDEAIALMLILFPPCLVCGYVKTHCRCEAHP